MTYVWVWPRGAVAGDQGEGRVRRFWMLTEIPPVYKQYKAGSNRTWAGKNNGVILARSCLIGSSSEDVVTTTQCEVVIIVNSL